MKKYQKLDKGKSIEGLNSRKEKAEGRISEAESRRKVGKKPSLNKSMKIDLKKK